MDRPTDIWTDNQMYRWKDRRTGAKHNAHLHSSNGGGIKKTLEKGHKITLTLCNYRFT